MMYPGASWTPGRNAGYAAGRNSLRIAVCHYTVGVASHAIGLRGFFHFLVNRDGTINQYAEADAVTWHACEWNVRGPGIEVEYLDGHDETIFNDAMRASTATLIDWLAKIGVQKTYFDGPRIDVGADVAGFIAHRALHEVACDEHYDYWPQEDWDAMVAPPREEDVTDYFTVDGTKNYKHVPGVGMVFAANATEQPGGQPAKFTQTWVSQADFDRMNTAGSTGSAVGTVTGTLTVAP